MCDNEAYGRQERQLNPTKPIHETAFPPTPDEAATFHLERCLRVMPHDQNTGGFFVAVFEKIAPFSEFSFRSREREAALAAAPESPKEISDDVPANPSATEDAGASTSEDTSSAYLAPLQLDWQPKKRGIEEPFILFQLLKCTANIQQSLTNYYAFREDFPWNRLVVRNFSDTPRNVSLISDGMNAIFKADARNLLRIINAGLIVFQHRKNPGTPDSIPYQMHSTGTAIISHFQSARIVDLPFEEFKAIALYQSPEYGISFLSESTRQSLEQLSVGPVTLRIELPSDVSDCPLPVIAVAGWKGRANLRLMIEQSQRQFLKYAFEKEL